MGNTSLRVISLKLPKDLDERLTRLAERRGTTRSTALRDALEALAEADEATSVLSVAGDLVGSLTGPADLSTAKRHMSGYGR